MMIVDESCRYSGGCYSTSLFSQFNLAINQVRLGDMGDRMMLEQSMVNMDEQVMVCWSRQSNCRMLLPLTSPKSRLENNLFASVLFPLILRSTYFVP